MTCNRCFFCVIAVIVFHLSLAAQGIDSVTYDVYEKVVDASGKERQVASFLLHIVSRDFEDASSSLTVTFSEVDMQVSGTNAFIIKSLEDYAVNVLISGELVEMKIHDISSLIKFIEERSIRKTWMVCDSYKYWNSPEAVISQVVLEQLMFLYPSIFQLSTIKSLSLTTDCPDQAVKFQVDGKVHASEAERITEFSLITDRTSLAEFYDCMAEFQHDCWNMQRENAMIKSGNDYDKLPLEKKRIVSRSDYVQATATYEDNQIAAQARHLNERINSEKQDLDGRSIFIESTYSLSESYFPENVTVTSETIMIPYWVDLSQGTGYRIRSYIRLSN
jgi:hypothetical protein